MMFRVVYFTATCPYVVLMILLVRGLTLEGYWKGIEFYIIPKWEKLMNMQVWSDAASQIFYSLGPGFGVLITMSSYNKFSNNCYRDAVLVSIINCCTSILAGFVIFSVLGFMAHVTNQPVEKVADSDETPTDNQEVVNLVLPLVERGGPGLVFIAYPEGLAQMPFAPVWSILFFFMLLMLGLDSQFAMVECVICAIMDEFLSLRKHKSIVTFAVCASMLGLGLPCVTKGGIWIVTLMDNYTASYSLLIVAFFEFIGINWIYGFKRFSDDIYLMLGKRPGFYWRATWTVISPLIVVVERRTACIETELLPGTLVTQNFHLSDVWKPTMSWGPAIDENRTENEDGLGGNKQNGLRNGVAGETASNTRMNPLYNVELPEVSRDDRRRHNSEPKTDLGY
ncbi:hypothetical protein KUTeg_024028 [Tegillarca granosa]|uniref:Uncharacterized protein n=1 Tax=Tegillarca granosa TaxID=220873 RepID=A0ABQ9E0R4_TEGGR|nr:hypothetical protein KUTeg_024028 [Tegillarca granosa]